MVQSSFIRLEEPYNHLLGPQNNPNRYPPVSDSNEDPGKCRFENGGGSTMAHTVMRIWLERRLGTEELKAVAEHLIVARSEAALTRVLLSYCLQCIGADSFLWISEGFMILFEILLQRVRDMPGSEMGKFTRILHSGKPDRLMEEIPTFIVDPFPEGLDRSELEKISPTWMNISLRMKDDPATDQASGWVQEMYAYAVASALHDVRHVLREDFMLQGELTYGKIGEWCFDKRSHLSGPPPRNLSLPPPGVPESVVSSSCNLQGISLCTVT
ncbi:subtilisin-like protease-like [Hibiscus syriacus]|uniref:Subtilisin-like protease-like n=1 Tax=Hibiscus syriacus TaxID=106335 RepID=A0A6A2YXL3_HIBSY|nr:subtilisin-like protease-like [Hibiscus syriacus]